MKAIRSTQFFNEIQFNALSNLILWFPVCKHQSLLISRGHENKCLPSRASSVPSEDALDDARPST